MYLKELNIENFRGIQHLRLELDSDTTVLIGENNSGKSTILEALRTCLSRSLTRRSNIFSEYDYFLEEENSQPVDSDPIIITMRFTEQVQGEWSDEILQILDSVIQVDNGGLQVVTLRVRSVYDDATDDFVTTWDFLDIAGNDLTTAKAPRHIISFQQLVPVFYLTALRNPAQEFQPRSQFWGPFVRSMKIEPEMRQELERELSELNQRVLDSHETFDDVKRQLRNTSEMLPLNRSNPVNIEAIPSKIFDILSRTQVMLTSTSGVRLPLGRHGEGTQSLSVICLFDAFLQSKLSDRYTDHSSPILALEEPEAHLHPSATRSASVLLQEIDGQKVIATHSGELISSVPLASLRRLRRKDGRITVYQVEEGSLTDDELQKIDFHVRSMRGSLLFARCWLLVEGEVDNIIFEECARVLNLDLISEGISCVAYSNASLPTLIKLADSLGIEWVVVADRDQSGENYIKSAERQLDARPKVRHLHLLDHGEMEVFLCLEGYGAFYESNVSPQKRQNITAAKGTLLYWQQVVNSQSGSKPQNAIQVAAEIESKGSQGVPSLIRDVIQNSIDLAQEAI